MLLRTLSATLAMLFVPGCQKAEHSSQAAVAPPASRVTETPGAAALREALDVAWRGDDWSAGLRLARRALDEQPDAVELRGRIARALWRAGRIEEAAQLAARIPADTSDPIALRALIVLHLARGQREPAARLADRLEALPARGAPDLYHILAARAASGRWDGLAKLARQLEQAADPAHGYPETYYREETQGLPAFLEAVGPGGLNQVAQNGSAPMTPLVLVGLPSCEVRINGHGPYRMAVDTGGSVTVALDEAVAEEIGLKSLSKGTVRGASGRQDTGYALIDDLQIGAIKCRRVMTIVFGVRAAIMNAADGIIGTGIFNDGRMTLDFAGAQLVVSASRAEAGPGRDTDLWLVGDAKLVTPVTLQGQPALAMLDTGADVVALAPSRLAELFPGREVQKITPGMGLGVGNTELPAISLNPGVDLTIAGRRHENYSGLGLDALDTALSPVMGVQTDVLVGMSLFREMRSCTVDYPRCKLWIDWLARE